MKKLIISTVFLLAIFSAKPLFAIFTENWTGADPDRPISFLYHPTAINWDITVHSRDGHSDGPWGDYRNYNLMQQPWDAQHTDTCGPPPGVHTIQAYEDNAYICKQHMMTSTFGPGASQVVLTPNHLLDLSQGDAVVRFNISTLRTAGRDYWQVNLTPLEDHQQLVHGEVTADLNGFPKNTIMVGLSTSESNNGTARAKGRIQASQIDQNHNRTALSEVRNTEYDDFLTPDLQRRDTFEIKLTQNRTHLTVCMPDYGKCFIDTDLLQPFPSTSAVIQFSHHSYNPYKDCNGSALCAPNTYHWDDFYMEPTIPFEIIKSTQRSHQVANEQPITVNFNRPATAGSRLRFAALARTNTLQVSYDGGNSWQQATPQRMQTYDDGVFWSYFTGDVNNGGTVPQGITSVQIKGQGSWRGDFIVVRDISLWSNPVLPPSLPPSLTPIETPASTATPAPVPTQGQLSPTPSPTPTPIDAPETPNSLFQEDFANISGALDGVNGWRAYNTWVETAPFFGIDQALTLSGNDARAYRPLPVGIGQGQRGILHFRIKRTGTADVSVGLSDLTDPINLNAYEVQMGSRLNSSGSNQFVIRSGGSDANTSGQFEPDQWHCIWLVIDNASDYYQAYALGGAYNEVTQLQSEGQNFFYFRNSTGDRLQTFYAQMDGGSAKVYIDDIYMMPDQTELTSRTPSCQSQSTNENGTSQLTVQAADVLSANSSIQYAMPSGYRTNSDGRFSIETFDSGKPDPDIDLNQNAAPIGEPIMDIFLPFASN